MKTINSDKLNLKITPAAFKVFKNNLKAGQLFLYHDSTPCGAAFQYKIQKIYDELKSDCTIITNTLGDEKLEIWCHNSTLDLVNGLEIDYQLKELDSYVVFNKTNSHSCFCGKSFRIEHKAPWLKVQTN